jgi:hypothetical protein
MAVETIIYVKTMTFKAPTYSWDSASGGPLGVRFPHVARAIEDRTGDAEWATFVAMVDKSLRCSANVRQVKWVIPIGEKGDIVLTLESKGTSTVTVTLKDMVYEGVQPSQDRAVPGGAEHSWVHENTDGYTFPVS